MSVAPINANVTPRTGRGLSPIWRGALQAFSKNDPLFGQLVIADDFLGPLTTNGTDASLTVGTGWFIQDAAAGGTVENLSLEAGWPEGVALLSATTGTDHFGIEMHYGTTSTSIGCVNLPTATTRPRGDVVFETRVDVTDQKQFFIGLTEPIVEFLGATSALPANSDYIGFFRSDGGGLQFVMANDNNGGTAVTDTYTLKTAAEMDALENATVDNNWLNLAFRVNKDDSIEVSVNEEWYGIGKHALNPLALPIEALTPKFGIYRGATDDQATVELYIDYIYVFVGAA